MRAIKWSSSSPRYLKKNKFVKYIPRKKGHLQLPEPEVQMTHSVNPSNPSTFVTCFQGQKEEHVKGSTQWRSEIVIILLFPNTNHRCPKSFIHMFHAVRSLHTIISLDDGITKIGALRQGNMFTTHTPSASI